MPDVAGSLSTFDLEDLDQLDSLKKGIPVLEASLKSTLLQQQMSPMVAQLQPSREATATDMFAGQNMTPGAQMLEGLRRGFQSPSARLAEVTSAQDEKKQQRTYALESMRQAGMDARLGQNLASKEELAQYGAQVRNYMQDKGNIFKAEMERQRVDLQRELQNSRNDQSLLLKILTEGGLDSRKNTELEQRYNAAETRATLAEDALNNLIFEQEASRRERAPLNAAKVDALSAKAGRVPPFRQLKGEMIKQGKDAQVNAVVANAIKEIKRERLAAGDENPPTQKEIEDRAAAILFGANLGVSDPSTAILPSAAPVPVVRKATPADY